jgi:hypothetical protein
MIIMKVLRVLLHRINESSYVPSERVQNFCTAFDNWEQSTFILGSFAMYIHIPDDDKSEKTRNTL